MKIKANKHKWKKHSQNQIDKLTILHNSPQKITHNCVDARAVHDNGDVEQNHLPQRNQLKIVRGQPRRRFTDDDLKHINIFFIYAKNT